MEDLPLAEFIRIVQNISSMHISLKLDGSQLWLGIDDEGKLFTSREGKRQGSTRFYSEEAYPRFAAYNGFRSAQAALEAKAEDVKRIVQPGQMVEMEVLYGRQPNAVTYGADGKSYIAFLRGVNGTPDAVADQLSMALGGTSVQVHVKIIDTTDGEQLEAVDQDVTYQFVGAQKIQAEKLKDVRLSKHLKQLQAYLREPAGLKHDPKLTNLELLQNSLGTVPAAGRQAAKAKKAEVLARIMTDFKLPIKQELLQNFVKKIEPTLQADDITADEDVGIEGVVLRDPTTGGMVKLVDKDAFSTINAFNHAIRNQISGVVKTLDGTAPLDARGGIVGNMKIRIADLLGNKELARGATAKTALLAARGADPAQTIKNFAKNLAIRDFLGMKRKLLALVQQAAADLRSLLEDFKANKENFRLKLKNGKTIGISPEVEKRTLLVFAESRKNLIELFDRVKKARTVAQVLAVLYGSLAKKIHADKVEDADNAEVTEGLILEKKYDTDKARYAGKDAYALMNIYFATVLMCIIFYQADDAKGLRLIRDKTHYRMARWDPQMSQLNFWGYVIWHASSPAVKKLIGAKAAAAIFKVARRATASQSRYLHMDLSFGRDVPLEYEDHRKTLHLLQQLDGMNTDRVNTLLDGVFSFGASSHDAQVKTIAKLYYYVMQFIPTSPLLIRLKAIQAELLLNANGENNQMTHDTLMQERLLVQVNALVEDVEGGEDAAPSGGSGPAVSQVDTVTRARDTASTDGVSSKKNRFVVKRKRNPAVKKAKFPRPDKEKDNYGPDQKHKPA